MSRYLTEEQFQEIYRLVPRICVDLAIFNEEEKILLTKRYISPYKGFWHLPGGGILRGEKVSQAIRRVSSKELGVVAIPEKFLGYFENTRDGYRHSISLVYRCKTAGRQSLNLEEASEAQFFGPIPKKTVPTHRTFIGGIRKRL